MNPDTSEEELDSNRKSSKKFLFQFRKKKILIILILLLAILALVEISKRVAFVRVDGENRLLLSSKQIKEEDKQVIQVEPTAGGFYSKKLNISLSLHQGLSGEEHLGKIKLHEEGKKGVITIERYMTDYVSLEDAERRTKNERLKKAVKSDFITKLDVKGKIYDVQNPTSRIYFFFFDRYIYLIEGSEPGIYDALDYVARGIYFGSPYDEARKRPTPSPDPTFTLQRKTTQGIKEVFIFEMNGLNYIKKWKDSLLFAYPYGYNSNNNLSIYQHSLSTGDTKILFQKRNDELMMSDLNIINDTLYFSLGGYLEEGESYWIDLNSRVEVAHMLASKSGDIVSIKGRNFFVKSEGDSCWGKSEFSLIDLKTKLLTPVAETSSGCGGSEEYLGINNKDQMIIASYGGVSGNYDYGWPSPSLYKSISVIPLSTPTIRKYVIPPGSMPQDILLVKYSEENDSLLLVGDALYIYTFISEKLKKIADFPQEWVQYKHYIGFSGWKGNIVCVEKSDEGNKKTIKLQINLETKQILRDLSECPSENKTESSGGENIRKKVEKIFKNLSLPSSYILTEK